MQRAVIREKYQQPIKVREIHVNAERPSPGSVANFDLLIPAHIVGSSLNILALSRIRLKSGLEDRWDYETKRTCTVRFRDSFLRVPLMYQHCCQDKLGSFKKQLTQPTPNFLPLA